MRSRLNVLVLGVASLIVVAFVVPLGLLVRQQADQRGRLDAERQAQLLAAIVVRSAISGVDPTVEELAELTGPIPDGSVILLPFGDQIGAAESDRALVRQVIEQRTALSSYNSSGFGVAIPVFVPGGTVVVYSSVPSEVLTRGVVAAWVLLAILGVGLVAAALVIADRLGRSVVGPSKQISIAAGRLGDGDLGTRVEESGPPELVAIAAAFNTLADRIRGLVAAEREEVADLSHRLRTPLTALRLQVERMNDSPERRAILDKVDGLGVAINDLISQARHPADPEQGVCDIVGVVRKRAEFWRVLADEQHREMVIEIGDHPGWVRSSADQAGAAVDALIGNVFSHTGPGTNFGIATRLKNDVVEVEVADIGQGFPADLDPRKRGISGADSSGLGLDIASRFAEGANGDIEVGNSPGGGARVVLTIPLSPGSTGP